MRSSGLNNGYDLRATYPDGKEIAPSSRMRVAPRNRVLAALPRHDLLRLWPHLEPVPLVRGTVLFEADEPLTRVYFVETGVVSLMAVFNDGATAEMATIGQEGLVGIGTIFGGEHAHGHYMVPVSGTALALELSRFQSALRASQELLSGCQAYAQAFFRAALQTAACNSVHRVEERCARWLLMSHDRNTGDTLALTQDCLAEMLGVCRSTVTMAASALQRAGLIRYRRGAISVLDRRGLEAASCECYHLIRQDY